MHLYPLFTFTMYLHTHKKFTTKPKYQIFNRKAITIALFIAMNPSSYFLLHRIFPLVWRILYWWNLMASVSVRVWICFWDVSGCSFHRDISYPEVRRGYYCLFSACPEEFRHIPSTNVQQFPTKFSPFNHPPLNVPSTLCRIPVTTPRHSKVFYALSGTVCVRSIQIFWVKDHNNYCGLFHWPHDYKLQ